VKVTATYSIKGGVGKTTTAVNLGYEASKAGARVLLWDLDPQGAATYLLRVRPKVKGGIERLVGADGHLAGHVRGSDIAALHVLPADFSLRHLDLYLDARKRPTERLAALLEPLAGRYDLVLLDCPPSISLASESVFGAADALLVPVVPSTLASRTLTQVDDFLADLESAPTVVPIMSMVDRRKKLHRELTERIGRQWPLTLKSIVPAASVVEQMGVERAPVGAFAPRAAASLAFRDAWVELAARLWP
jgi:chromosome partitioning protein